MTDASTILELLSALGVGLTAGVLAVRSRLRKPADTRQAAYLRDHAVRLALAQHWARGGLLSEQSEPWSVACTSLAVAALAVETIEDLAPIIDHAVGMAGADPEVVNVFRQARAELGAARVVLSDELATGYRPDGSPGWNFRELRVRSETLLEHARISAEQLTAARRAGGAT